VNSIKRLVLQKNQQEISGEGILPPGPHRAYFDLETLGSALEYRYWKDGDSFFPLGMEKPKKLSDFFIDLKIPRGEKSRIHLVLHLDQIIWVVGYRNDHRYRITEFTRSILCIEYRNPQ
jgi:tRNA(Ile)-lysidine synthase